MSPREFCYWLQGYIEVAQPASIDAAALEQIKKHLALVFTNVTSPSESAPSVPSSFPSFPGLGPVLC